MRKLLTSAIAYQAFTAMPSGALYTNKYNMISLETRNYIHIYHSRFIPEGVAEASQIFLRDAHVLPKLFGYE
jgi:hypothetical protein